MNRLNSAYVYIYIYIYICRNICLIFRHIYQSNIYFIFTWFVATCFENYVLQDSFILSMERPLHEANTQVHYIRQLFSESYLLVISEQTGFLGPLATPFGSEVLPSPNRTSLTKTGWWKQSILLTCRLRKLVMATQFLVCLLHVLIETKL